MTQGWDKHIQKHGIRGEGGYGGSVNEYKEVTRDGGVGAGDSTELCTNKLLFKQPLTRSSVPVLCLFLVSQLKINYSAVNQVITTLNRLRLSSSLCPALSFSILSSSSPLRRTTLHSVPLS
jgi:hypothetical protein